MSTFDETPKELNSEQKRILANQLDLLGAQLNLPADSTWNITQAVNGFNTSVLANPHVLLNKLGKPMVIPVFIVDPTGASSMNGATMDAYGQGNPMPLGILNTFTMLTEIPRTPTWFKSVVCTTIAATAIVAAVAGKKHRILGGIIICAAGLLAAGTELISIIDNATDTGLDFQTYLPIAASLTGTSNPPTINLDLKPNGYLALAVNTAINVTLSAAVTAGGISVTLWGDDE